ncbi:unnamed protein product [Macrosiphum euphorbiae]|uniref:MULE transposase domain-containing protein n=1 Tax=Macrosiphum euphorbiae TaxID=13131 RepID=A0AAV0XM92_9HEMI|nr:unnamed protein product [Macrosiphum euphorbiae]
MRKYYFERTLIQTGEKKWRCCVKKCPAFIKILEPPIIISSSNEDHKHESCSEQMMQRQQLSASVKRKATDNPHDKPSKVLIQCLNDQSTSKLEITDLKYIKRNAYNARRNILPPLPKNMDSIHEAIEQLNIKTIQDEHFVLTNNVIDNLIIFSCKSYLRAFFQAEIVYLDGTFDFCAKFFYQFVSFHGYLNGHYVPLIFCLLKDKKESTYKQCFQTINELCNEIGSEFKPNKIVTDFEKGLRNACMLQWPGIQLDGCRFHLSQAWYRAIQRFGLAADYKNDESEISKWLHYCFGLIFLNPEDVENCFSIDLYNAKPNDDRLDTFYDYLKIHILVNEQLFHLQSGQKLLPN